MVSKRIKFFKATSILMIISGCFAILFSCFVMIAGAILLTGNRDYPAEITSVLWSFAGMGVAFAIAAGILQLFTGIYSKRNLGNPDKINTFIHLGSIAAILHVISQIWDFLSVGFHAQTFNVGVYIGLVIPAFYIISAVQLKVKDESFEKLDTELTAFVGFFAKHKERIYEILFTLIICGFIGWAFETVETWIHYGRLTARGMLFISHINGFPIIWGLPLILMYGIGGAILI